ncbi:hypothetical protein BJY00DRAFT_315361 [Aspergillus carlsbadensis]|nr:hypothetical protein BJY00DRAFT_315361 [Aspergillus carlsbadensis]
MIKLSLTNNAPVSDNPYRQTASQEQRVRADEGHLTETREQYRNKIGTESQRGFQPSPPPAPEEEQLQEPHDDDAARFVRMDDFRLDPSVATSRWIGGVPSTSCLDHSSRMQRVLVVSSALATAIIKHLLPTLQTESSLKSVSIGRAGPIAAVARLDLLRL